MKRLVWNKLQYPLDFFGICTGENGESFLYDDLINDQHRKYSMVEELYLGVRHKKFTYKGKFDIDYKVNQLGYRGPDTGKTDLLASGCSQTFGVGVPEALTWPRMLADNNNISYNSLAYPGNSTIAMVEDAFKYFDLFGHPKHIRFLVPDFLRFKFIKAANENFFIQNSKGNIGDFINTVPDPDRSMLKFEKMPIPIEKIMPTAMSFRSNLIAIKHMEAYCNEAGIDFKWATWHNELSSHFKRYDYGFKNYVYSVADNSIDYLSCHKEIQDIDPRFFTVGDDPQEHMGSHAHAHYASLLQIV
jgi:hypothetical protein